jgi:phosphate:Na+ symporter
MERWQAVPGGAASRAGETLMAVDVFKDVIVPVVGGLGIFMLGLEFMSQGIQALAVNRMRSFLGKVAGTPVKGVLAGTLITGIIQSSTAMTVMVVGLVNAGVVSLRPAISVIMGANIGTTLGNGLIALPLGPLGLLLGGIFALVYVFAKSERTKNIALACMGFALIFYGLNLMTGGLRPLRGMPEVMGVISSLQADGLIGLITCIAIAATITALIHSSSATIGIVMGLGAAGVLDWQTAVAFSLGADLGTTITSWIASLNLSKNAKRAAYAHISFNVIGVLVMIPLFFPAMIVLRWVMGWFGGDPGVPVLINGKETFPLVPVAVGLYSTAFNIFNTALLFPFIAVFDRVLSRIGKDASEDVEDYTTPRYLRPGQESDVAVAMPAVQRELARYLEGATAFLALARGDAVAPVDAKKHAAAIDILSRDIRGYTARMFRPGMSHGEADLVASLIEEEDFAASLGEVLHQIGRRVQRETFSPAGRALVDALLAEVIEAMAAVTTMPDPSAAPVAAARLPAILALRDRTVRADLPATDRGAILALLGSAERALMLIERIDAERRSVPRLVAVTVEPPVTVPVARPDFGGAAPVPAE